MFVCTYLCLYLYYVLQILMRCFSSFFRLLLVKREIYFIYIQHTLIIDIQTYLLLLINNIIYYIFLRFRKFIQKMRQFNVIILQQILFM